MRYIQCSPKVSIIIPVFNNEKFLTRCLDSIIAQSYDDWECILVDDGSSDNSGMICEDYAKKDNRLRVIHQKNAGVSIARNVGLDASYGEWICFVDSDDWIDNNLISELLSCAEKNDAEVVVSGNKRVDYEKILKPFGLNPTPSARSSSFCPPEGMLTMPEDFEVYLQGPCSKLFKRTVLDKHNIRFPENISLAEDLLFTFKVFFSTKKVWGVSKSFYNYYQNQYSAVHTISPEKREIKMI